MRKRILSITATLAVISASANPAQAENLKSLKREMFICWSLSTFSGKE